MARASIARAPPRGGARRRRGRATPPTSSIVLGQPEPRPRRRRTRRPAHPPRRASGRPRCRSRRLRRRRRHDAAGEAEAFDQHGIIVTMRASTLSLTRESPTTAHRRSPVGVGQHLEQAVDRGVELLDLRRRTARRAGARARAGRPRSPVGGAQTLRREPDDTLRRSAGSAVRSTSPARSSRSTIWVMPPLERSTISLELARRHLVRRPDELRARAAPSSR